MVSIGDNLCKALNLQMVQVPLIVDRDSGVNDYLDRDGSRTPVEFPCGLGLDKPIQAQVVQAATKWKRMALKQFGCRVGEGICEKNRCQTWNSELRQSSDLHIAAMIEFFFHPHPTRQ